MSQRLGLVPSERLEQRTLVSDTYAGGKLCQVGDIVLNRLKAHLGVFAVARHEGVISPDYSVFRCGPSASPQYFERTLRSAGCRSELRVRAKGIVEGFWRLYTDDFYDIRLPVPPPEEQCTIVRFLDHVDRRIRRYIRAKQKLIALLEEQKQAIIHRAVTRGLDPNVRLKPSGVAWLGDVPEHWNVVALKRACALLRDGTHLPPPRVEMGVPLLSVRNIIEGKFVRRDDDSMISDADYRQLCRSFVPQENDVLLAVVGATLGKVAVVPRMGGFHIQRSLAVFRTKAAKLSHAFLAAYLRAPSFQRALWTTVAFSAQPGIYLNTLANFSVVVPPVEEQNRIVSFLTYVSKDLETAIAGASGEITLLQEYRTRLTSDVVTGKFDVREAAAQLPDDFADSDEGEESSQDIEGEPDDMDDGADEALA